MQLHNNGLVALDLNIFRISADVLNIGKLNWKIRLDRLIDTTLYVSNSNVFNLVLIY